VRQIARPEPKRAAVGAHGGMGTFGACSVCWEGDGTTCACCLRGRLYTDMVAVWRILDAIHRKHGLTCVIDGACPMEALICWHDGRGTQL